MGKLIEAVILDSVAAAHADVTWDEKAVSITGQSNPLLMRDLIYGGFKYKAYAAGTAKVVSYAITGTALSKYYDFYLFKWPTGEVGITTTDQKYFETEKYTVYSGDSGTANENVATNLAAKITAYINSLSSPWTSAIATTNSVAVTAASANLDFDLKTYHTSVTITPTVSTALVEPSGTTALANDILNQVGKSATSGKNYATYIWTTERPTAVTTPSQGVIHEQTDIYWFVDSGDADFATFNNFVTQTQAPTSTAETATGNDTTQTVGSAGNTARGVVTTGALTTAAGAKTDLVVPNSLLKAGSHVQAFVSGGTNTQNVNVDTVVVTAGTMTIRLANDDAAALDGTVIVSYKIDLTT